MGKKISATVMDDDWIRSITDVELLTLEVAMKTLQLEPTLVGVAGEYFVAAELSLRGFLASVTLRNSRGIDIIASNADASKTVSIQVKSNKSGKASWLLSKKSESFFADNHYYVFVALHPLGVRPDFFIVPSGDVADYIYRDHANWLAGTKADGSERKNSNMRVFKDFDCKYKERWENLGL